jgi:hypothetical protein
VGDLPALRRDREGDAEWLQQLGRPGAGGDDHAIRADLLGAEPDPGDASAAGQ